MNQADPKTPSAKPVVVLVHGAWADGSCWREVVALLQAKGRRVVSVQPPLSSLAEDVEVVMRAVNLQNSPVVLVGHCYGGTVITQAGCDSRVVALVYVAAFAPDAGDSTIDSQKDYPPPPFIAHFRVDAGGFIYLSQDAFREYFAQDLPAAESSALAAAQVPIRVSAFAEKVTAAAWRAKPSWYVVADEDRIIYPDLQRQFAQRMNATVVTLRASHVPFLSKPRETTAVIIAATEAVGRS